MTAQGVRLFVGGHAGTVQGEREDLVGDRMFSAAHQPQAARIALPGLRGLLDSGAFTDKPERRLTPERALDRQLRFEATATRIWKGSWQAYGLVSYDRLIDETWVAGERHKRRWSVRQAESAVRETVEAAKYLAGERARLGNRRLVLSAQGVDALQYAECAAGVLQSTCAGDMFGLGGWCILGLKPSLLPTFWATLRLVLPMVAYAGVKEVHIFGVMWLPALGGLLYLADELGLSVSTDSTGPVLACTWKDAVKAGARMTYWRNNVTWWKTTLRYLRNTKHYKAPPEIPAMRQETFL